MNRKKEMTRCAYCGAKVHNGSYICYNCYEKRKVIHKLLEIGTLIKAEAEKERYKRYNM